MEANVPASVRQSFQYGYDRVGNRIWVKNASGSGDVYKYDAAYRLIGVKYGVSNPQDGYNSAVGAVESAVYAYDAVGNRTQMTVGTTTTNYSVNSLNQYTQIGENASFSYDANGNLAGNGIWTYSYDPDGHLVEASNGGTTIAYKYDAMDRRVEKSVNGLVVTKYVYSGSNLIEELDGSNAVISKYVYAEGVDQPVKMMKGGNDYYYQQDGLGSVTSLVDENGNIYESYTYDVFGKPVIKDGNGVELAKPSQPFLFTGREYDSETKLYHYRTRSYSPDLGRFLQPDSTGLQGGDVNLYSYAFNNPASKVDPSGESAASYIICISDCVDAHDPMSYLANLISLALSKLPYSPFSKLFGAKLGTRLTTIPSMLSQALGMDRGNWLRMFGRAMSDVSLAYGLYLAALEVACAATCLQCDNM